MASHRPVAVSWLETMIEQLTGVERAFPDPQGDYPLHHRLGDFYARIDGGETPVLRLYAVIVADIECSPALLTELNRINTRLTFPRVFWIQRQVLMETNAVAIDTTHNEFNQLCHEVASASDHFGQKILSSFGGTPVFQQSSDDVDEEEEASPPHRPGYL